MNTHDIELPAEFRSGNDIPVTQATIKRERMEEILRDAIEADRKRTTELLKNPVHVHTNMCRGIIAPITFDMLAHVLGEEATQAWLNDRKRRGEPVSVPEALRQIASWMDDGGPSHHEAEMIGMALSGPVECSSHQACTKAAKLAFLEAARIWEHINPIAPQPAEPCVSSVSDKTTCGSASGDCDSQRAEPVTLECPKCGVDRAKAPCAGNLMDCEFKGVAHAAEPVKVPSDPAVAAIQFALKTDEGIPFLHCWNEGNFDAIRREWPEAPESVFIGADPMHPETRALLARYGQPAQPAASTAPVSAQSSVPKPLKYGREWKDHYVTGWNNCRAAMLAAEQAQQECGCCGRSDGCDPDCDASQPAANDDPTPEEEEAWQRMERRS